jgi:hypothetical protein
VQDLSYVDDPRLHGGDHDRGLRGDLSRRCAPCTFPPMTLLRREGDAQSQIEHHKRVQTNVCTASPRGRRHPRQHRPSPMRGVRCPKFAGSPTVASRSRLQRFLAPHVATWRGWRRSPSRTRRPSLLRRRGGELVTANFRELPFQRLSGNSYARANRLTISRVIAA